MTEGPRKVKMIIFERTLEWKLQDIKEMMNNTTIKAV